MLVTVIIDNLAEGLGRDEILRSYPTLEPVHIDAALAELAREESLLPLRPRVRFKFDENLPVELLDDLRAAGHEADGLRDEGLIGASDDVVLELVRRESRVLVTLDKGIADVRAYPPEAHAGIVLFRPPAAGSRATLLFMRRHLASLFERDLTGRLLVITDHGLRLR